ncbi:MAG: hypothetical protein V1797_21290 [Pseudomonadota bacterium]
MSFIFDLNYPAAINAEINKAIKQGKLPLTSEALNRVNAATLRKTKDELDDLIENRHNELPLTAAMVRKYYKLPDPKPEVQPEPGTAPKNQAAKDPWQYKVALGAPADFTSLGIYAASAHPKKANPATFSLSRDMSEGYNEWSARGAVFFAMVWELDSEPPKNENHQAAGDDGSLWRHARRVSLGNSLSIDRQASNKPQKKDVDSTIFRTGVETTMRNLVGIPIQYWLLQAAVGTDTGLESCVGALEAEWQPVLGTGWGTTADLIPKVTKFRISFLARTEYGQVFGVGNHPLLQSGEDFLRLGPAATLEIWPIYNLLPRLSLTASARYMWGIFGDPGSTSLIDLRWAYFLDEKQQFTLSLGYRSGELPLTLEQVDMVDLSLGFQL